MSSNGTSEHQDNILFFLDQLVQDYCKSSWTGTLASVPLHWLTLLNGYAFLPWNRIYQLILLSLPSLNSLRHQFRLSCYFIDSSNIHQIWVHLGIFYRIKNLRNHNSFCQLWSDGKIYVFCWKNRWFLTTLSLRENMLSGDLFSLRMIYFNTAEKWEKECFFGFFFKKKLILFGV